MNKIRPIILAVVVVLSALLAYGLWTLPSPQPADAEGFSAERVVKDIEVISKEHHSVAHPQERARVREYLVQRLEGLGADTVLQFGYDSLTSPSNRPFVYTFDAVDILAEFPPLNPSDDDTYLMFVAHFVNFITTERKTGTRACFSLYKPISMCYNKAGNIGGNL